MAQTEAAYNPIGYHVGTVWPHDCSILAAGLARYGQREAASWVALAILQASYFFHYRLPEVFAGYGRDHTVFPVEYPTACSPQAWASGTLLLAFRVLLGLEPVGDKPGPTAMDCLAQNRQHPWALWHSWLTRSLLSLWNSSIMRLCWSYRAQCRPVCWSRFFGAAWSHPLHSPSWRRIPRESMAHCNGARPCRDPGAS